MQLTKEQFYNYIKENGITKAELTEDFKPKNFGIIPKKTILYFGISGNNLSTYDYSTGYANKAFDYNFEFKWDEYWYEYYKGKFKIIPESTMDKSKIITKLKSLTAKRNKLDSDINKLIEML